MNRVALLLGGNQGDRRQLIEQATVLIQQRIGAVVTSSRQYETAPWGEFAMENGEQGPENFLNQALLVETAFTAHETLREALAIEAELGRVRSDNSQFSTFNSQLRKYHSRPMDIDLIFFNDEVIDTPDLTIPHPRMHLRRFVLEPLAEIMPDYCHPLLKKTMKEMLNEV